MLSIHYSHHSRFIRLGCGMLAVSLVILGSGCSSVSSSSFANPFESLMPKSAESTTAQQMPREGSKNLCTVEFRTRYKQPQVIQIPITDGMCVQDALKTSGAQKRFSRMDVELARQVPKSGWLKMEVNYDNSKRTVESAFDYAIHPGDRLIITEDNSTTIDRMLTKMTNSVTKTSGK